RTVRGGWPAPTRCGSSPTPASFGAGPTPKTEPSGLAEAAGLVVLARVVRDVLEERLQPGADLVGGRQLGHPGTQQAGPLAPFHERVVLPLQRLDNRLDLVGAFDLAGDLRPVEAGRGGEVGRGQAETRDSAHRTETRERRVGELGLREVVRDVDGEPPRVPPGLPEPHLERR